MEEYQPGQGTLPLDRSRRLLELTWTTCRGSPMDNIGRRIRSRARRRVNRFIGIYVRSEKTKCYIPPYALGQSNVLGRITCDVFIFRSKIFIAFLDCEFFAGKITLFRF